METVSIVIPAYNEEHRLPATLHGLREAIAAGALEPLSVSEVIVVDDGSKDETVAVAKSFARDLPNLRVLSSGSNRGKGHAVRTGIQAAAAKWALMADADMSTPWDQAAKLAREALSRGAPVAIGSRDVEGSQVKRHQSFVREYLGKTFNVFVRGLTRLPFKDTQCGFKLFDRKAIDGVLSRMAVDGFAWDVELLMIAKKLKLKIVEVPVVWAHKEESRVGLVRHGSEMVRTVLRLRLKS